MNDQQVVTELIEEKIATLQHKVADARATIELYKNWQDGSPQQQRSRKRSYKRNLEKLPILESKVTLIKSILSMYD